MGKHLLLLSLQLENSSFCCVAEASVVFLVWRRNYHFVSFSFFVETLWGWKWFVDLKERMNDKESYLFVFLSSGDYDLLWERFLCGEFLCVLFRILNKVLLWRKLIQLFFYSRAFFRVPCSFPLVGAKLNRKFLCWWGFHSMGWNFIVENCDCQ